MIPRSTHQYFLSMFSKFSIFILLLSLTVHVAGQETDTLKNGLFTSGVYLQDRKVTIPWNTGLEDIGQYGHPKIEVPSGRIVVVHWDSVSTLNGISISLRSGIYRSGMS